MPQMAPLFWLSLLMFFLFSLMLFFTLNYFIKPYKAFSSLPLIYSLPPYLWKL
uniref:ATP synthase F0 subunit 8 n=1 Tax=Neilupotamon xinganense TaxID=2739372 RepID=A0A7D3Q602_9EUCA|nr:ATP synthase F0 subunit 8 [Neilupotamon xinganense]QKE31059.1 ATP synthase F0 subunit 8 [Neilupotamon xinganense]